MKESEEFYSNSLGMAKVFGSGSDDFIAYPIENAQILLEPEEKREFEWGR